MESIWADSGEFQDFQAAVDEASTGDNVILPSGIFDAIVDPNRIGPTNRPVGVIIPGGVNVFGQGKDRTIMKPPYEPPLYAQMLILDGRNGLRSRISGFGLENFVDQTEDTSPSALCILGATDYRADHLKLLNWTGSGISPINYYPPYGANRGVIDHCEFDNPYKDTFWQRTGQWPYWGYGISPVGTFYNWVSDINTILGKYDNIDNVCYIEDCTFRRCRHDIASTGGAHYVARHNYFTEMILGHYGSYIDSHGTSRLIEVYDNVIENSPMDYRSTDQEAYWGQYLGIAIGQRGGAGVIFNNTLKNFIGSAAVQLSNDQSNEQYRLNEAWVWNNIYDNSPNRLQISPGDFPIVEGTEYFLYAKPSYVPYPYPHPLVSGVQMRTLTINSNIEGIRFELRRVGGY